MDEEEGTGPRLSKRFDGVGVGGGEVDYKTKAGTAWSHSYLNQKPWHPLSYPNQRRKWIAEQTHAQRERRAEEVAREYAKEQEFFRQTALVSKKEKEKMENMRAVSFMYVRPPGYNAESAKAAEIADETKNQEPDNHQSSVDMLHNSMVPKEEKKKPRPKDVFGRALPTEEQFDVLKNAPRLETGVAARSKPFGIEIRNVKCVRCGTYGHQSGDRECPLKDAIMPNEENRLKRDDPLTAIMAQTDATEPLKWELKQRPGMSPPRGGFRPDDPNQQIVAADIYDEYGGFLGGNDIPDLLSNFFSSKQKKSAGKRKHKGHSSPKSSEVRDRREYSSSDDDSEGRRYKKIKKKKRKHSESSVSDDSEVSRHTKRKKTKRQVPHSHESSDSKHKQRQKHRKHHSHHHHRRRSASSSE